MEMGYENDMDDDNDGLSDYEEELVGTNPLLSDSDGDGKTDKVDGLNDSDADGIINALDSAIRDSDADGVVDEQDSDNSDPTNDSDGDGQANIKELECSEGDPLDESKMCPWATESAEGQAMVSLGFTYVPGGFDVDGDGVDEHGFWVSSYQARKSGVEISSTDVISYVGNYLEYIQEHFTLQNSDSPIEGYIGHEMNDTLKGEELVFDKETVQSGKVRVSSFPPYLALASLDKYEIRDSNGVLVNNNLKLMTQKQYMHISKLLQADFDNGGDGTTLRNGLLGKDIQVPISDYGVHVYEFGEKYKEYIDEIVWLIDKDLSVQFDVNEDVPDWWGVDRDRVLYNHDGRYGANSTLDVGMGVGTSKDNYAVVVRGGAVLDLTQGTTGVDSDSLDSTNGIGFRAVSPYLE